MDLFNWEEQWQIFVLENLLIAKKLFDKGFTETRQLILETGNFDSVAQILFGKENIKEKPLELVLSPEQELLLEKGAELENELQTDKGAETEEDFELQERAFFLNDFLCLEHYRMEIRIPEVNLLWPNQVKKLEQDFQSIAYTLEEWEDDTSFCDRYPYWNYLAGAGWLLDRGKKVGIWFHTVSSDYDEEPWSERVANEFLIQVWDSLRIARAFHLRRKSLCRRLILFSGGNSDDENQRGEALLRIKRDPKDRKRLRQRNKDRARAGIPGCDSDA